jgi:ParB family chromosome partitioning protein
MTRRDVFAHLKNGGAETPATTPPAEPAREASISAAAESARRSRSTVVKSMGQHLRTITEQAKADKEALIALQSAGVFGERLHEIDVALIDPSPIRDRIGGEDEDAADAALRESIAQDGQQVPILLRPNAARHGRYLTVYGHRRIRALRALERPALAVVREMNDEDAFVAQGNENNERRNTSFIEKALFATQLATAGLAPTRIGAALGAHRTLVHQMTGLVKDLPADLISAIGAAPGVGRPRWRQLADLVKSHPPKMWKMAVQDAGFAGLGSDERFAFVQRRLTMKAAAASGPRSLTGDDGRPLGSLQRTSKGDAIIRLTGAQLAPREDGLAFDDWLAGHIAQLFGRWKSGE